MTENRDLFWDLLEREYVPAMMFCRKLAGDRDNGDDLYQDALMIAFARFDDLRNHGAFRGWLYRIIVSTFKRTVRRPWYKRRQALTAATEEALSTADPVSAHTARRWLARAFRAVSPEEQALVTLYEMEEWTIAELAELYGKRPGAIKTRLHRARRRMKKALDAYLAPASADDAAGENGSTTTDEEEPWTATRPETG